jgi:hypothetical protein
VPVKHSPYGFESGSARGIVIMAMMLTTRKPVWATTLTLLAAPRVIGVQEDTP